MRIEGIITMAKRSKDLAEKLTAIRESKGMTRYALAKAAGVSFNGLRSIENGEVSPSVAILTKLAEAMDCRLVVEFEALKK